MAMIHLAIPSGVEPVEDPQAIMGHEPTSMQHREANVSAVAVAVADADANAIAVVERPLRVTPPVSSDNEDEEEDEDELRDLSVGDAGELRAFVEKRRWFEGKLAVSRASEWGVNVDGERGEVGGERRKVDRRSKVGD